MQGKSAHPNLCYWHNRYLFTGREYDAETGNYFYRARYYSPRLGRFLGQDPIGYQAGDANLYRYVFNNPANLVDPDGKFVLASLAIAIGAGALIGGTVGGIGYALTHRGDQFKSNEFWKTVGIGAASGAVAGAVGWAIPVLLPATGSVWGAMGIGALSGALASGAGQITTNLLTPCTEWHHNLGWSMLFGGIGGGIAGGVGYGIRTGMEFRIGRNLRIAPFGNRTGHPTGRLPHYHRRVVLPSGEVAPGQGIGRHRPWDIKFMDTSFWDRW